MDPFEKAINAVLVAFKCEGGADPSAAFLALSRRNPRGFGKTLKAELQKAFRSDRLKNEISSVEGDDG
jgi:hypothetical protein